MKTLFYRQQEATTKFLWAAGEIPTGIETEVSVPSFTAEEMGVSKMVDRISQDIGNLNQTSKATINKIILDAAGEDGLYDVHEMKDAEERIEFLLGKDISLSVEQNEVSKMNVIETVSYEPLAVNQVSAFGEKGTDDIQDKLEKSTEGTSKMPYIDPEKGLINGKGEVVDASITLQKTVSGDLSSKKVTVESIKNGEKITEMKTLQESIQTKGDLFSAVKSRFENTTFSMKDAELVTNVIHGKVEMGDAEGQVSVKQLQESLAKISPEFKDLVGRIDNKYGRSTRETVRKVGALLSTVVEQHVEVTTRIENKINFESFENSSEGWEKMLGDYKRVFVALDRSGSMMKDFKPLGKFIKNSEFGQDGSDKQIGMATYERSIDVGEMSGLGDKSGKEIVKDIKQTEAKGSKEYGMDAAISILNLAPEKGGFPLEGDPNDSNLLPVLTDENLQGVTLEKLNRLTSIAREKNVDVVFMISTQDGSSITPIHIDEVRELYINQVSAGEKRNRVKRGEIRSKQIEQIKEVAELGKEAFVNSPSYRSSYVDATVEQMIKEFQSKFSRANTKFKDMPSREFAAVKKEGKKEMKAAQFDYLKIKLDESENKQEFEAFNQDFTVAVI